MSALLYFVSAAATLYIAQRVTCFSRAAAIVLFLLPLLFTGRALFTGGVFGPVDLAYTSEPLASVASRAGAGAVMNPSISDVYAEFMPWNDALRRAIRRGEWPLWNPYELCGTPLAGSAQSSSYHPITLLGFLIPLRQYFAFAAAMMLLFAVVSAFLFFRDFTESGIAALFGATAWMCSTHVVFFAGTALALAAAIAPLVLLGAHRIVREPGVRSTAILASALLLVVLAGHPESALHIVTLAVAYFAFEALSQRERMAKGRMKGILLSGIAAGVVALMLSAIFVLPILEAIPQSEEYVHRALGYRQIGSTVAQMLHRLNANFFPFLEGAPGLEEPEHAPGVRHGWLATSYAGSMLFAPALFALKRSRLRERWFFLGAIVFGLAAGIGAPGVTHILSRLPGFTISVNDRMIMFATLGLSALAAIGIDLLDVRLAKLFAGVAAVVLIAALAIQTGVSSDYLYVGATRAIVPVVLSACAIFLLEKRHASFVLLALLLAQRAGEASALQPTLPARAFYPEFAGLSLLRAGEAFRIVGVGTMLTPEVSTHYGLEDIRGFQGLTFGRLHETYPMWSVRQPVWSNRVDRLDTPILSLMNTRYAIVPPAMQLPPWWQMRATYETYGIAENTRVLPRVFVPRSIRVVDSPGSSLLGVSTITDFGEQGIVQDKQSHDFAPNGPGVVELRGRGSHVRLHVRMSGPGWVIVSNAYWKGWTAREHGRRIPVRFGDHVFTAFYLHAGEHDLELTYRPRSFVIGAWISGLTALMLLAYAFLPSSVITFFMSFQTSFFADGVRSRYAG
ncbi:MAG TPA: YfhO family protein [Thermoanaerobaculia bacterium]